jgi:hypothetical protein
MHFSRLLRTPRSSRSSDLGQHMERGFSTAEAILLLSFSSDDSCFRSYTTLWSTLYAAGFTGPQARHLVRNSPLLMRAHRNSYRLRPCEEV